jgi:hypothetical protein
MQRTPEGCRTLSAVSGFREHFLEKYFAYRRRYVDHILRQAPERARLANLSEMARLAFVAVGSALVGLIFALLTAGAAVRAGSGAWWTPVFALLAIAAAAATVGGLAGIVTAARDRARVSSQAGLGSTGSRP